MGDGFTPRAVLIVVMLLLLPVGMYHRVKSQSTREALDRRQEGVFILATLRPLGAALWFGVIAWMINPAWMAWSSVRVPLWSMWAGVPILLAGAAAAGVDVPLAWKKPHRHGGHAEAAHVGLARALPLGQTSVVFVGGVDRRCAVAGCGELVFLRRWHGASVSACRQNTDRGSKPGCPLRGQLPPIHGANGALRAKARLTAGYSSDNRSATIAVCTAAPSSIGTAIAVMARRQSASTVSLQSADEPRMARINASRTIT